MIDLEKVELRQADPGNFKDIAYLLAIKNDPENYQYYGKSGIWTKDQIVEFIKKERFLFIAEYDGKRIGRIGLYDIKKGSARVGRTFVNEDCRGNQIGALMTLKMIQIAYHQLNVKTVYCEVRASNNASYKMHQRLGFYPIRTKKGTIYMQLDKLSRNAKDFCERYGI